jgi:predicted amidohydrolase YtcJ
MQAMVERVDSEGVIVGRDERVSIYDALWTYTVGSAQTTGSSGSKGMLAPGMWADYVVLGSDPVETPTENLSQIQVRQTVVGGESIFSVEVC